MNLARTWRHLLATRWGLRRVFTQDVLGEIERAIRETEGLHGGEIRVAIENELDSGALWHDVTPRERAIGVFSHLGVWDTELNNGVLIYVLWADHDVEIVADRAFRGVVAEQEWRDICQRMEKSFAAEQPQRALGDGIRAVGQLIARHFPATDRNELPDRPVLL
ncbi:MAG TPA: TPM domain-containing protein [Povalibacter sp.]|nr:TPM domain-containing protein [Povalibacter sp.]